MTDREPIESFDSLLSDLGPLNVYLTWHDGLAPGLRELQVTFETGLDELLTSNTIVVGPQQALMVIDVLKLLFSIPGEVNSADS